MKAFGQMLFTAAVGLLLLAVAAPVLLRLSSALVPLVIVVAVALIAVRVVFFHTRRW